MFSTLLYGGYLGIPPIYTSNGWDVALFVITIVLIFPMVILSYFHRNGFAFLLFLVWSWMLGFLERGILIWAASSEIEIELLRQIFIMVTLAASISVALTAFIGYYLADRYDFNILLGAVLAFGLALLILEPILIWTFGFNETIVWTSLLVIGWIVAGTLYDGAKIREDLSEDTWMISVMNLFLDIVVLTIRLFIIIVKIFADSKSDD
jgi:predicted MFS family arabinose efflux permease